MKSWYAAFIAMLLALGLTQSAQAQITIGHYDATRELYGMAGGGPYINGARQWLLDQGHTLVATDNVDTNFLVGVDAFYVGLVSAVSADEISAFQQFVTDGGFLFIQTDYQPSNWANAANAILAAWGIVHGGTYINDVGHYTVGTSSWVTEPNVVAGFIGDAHSVVTSHPSDFEVLARDDADRIIMGVFDTGGGRSSDVFIATDIDFWSDATGWKDVRNRQLWENIWQVADDQINVDKRMQWNDYDGDGVSDPTVYDPSTGNWFILKQVGDLRALAWYQNWGFPGAIPLPGDYNGDLRNDLAVYDPATGDWYVSTLAGDVLAWGLNWGFPGAIPVPGDYNGDGVCDLAVYDPATGDWYVSTLGGDVLAWGVNWGFPGAVPVPGDYNGNQATDLAVYNPLTGDWYVMTIGGEVLAWAVNWGYRGAIAVPGDYNGDGRSDLAVYDTRGGLWFIRQLSIQATVMLDGEPWEQPLIADGVQWGFPGARTAVGDFNGDGRHDLALYDDKTLNWWIRTVDGQILNWELDWGYPGALPVSLAPLR